MKETKKMQQLGQAQEMAMKAHLEQTYAFGRDYYTSHVWEVYLEAKKQLDPEFYSATDIHHGLLVALLHDVIEDSDITYEDIREKFGVQVADMVDQLTHGDETYERYILRVRQTYIPRIIKRCDALVNLRASMMTASAGRVAKYARVLETLEG